MEKTTKDVLVILGGSGFMGLSMLRNLISDKNHGFS